MNVLSDHDHIVQEEVAYHANLEHWPAAKTVGQSWHPQKRSAPTNEKGRTKQSSLERLAHQIELLLPVVEGVRVRVVNLPCGYSWVVVADVRSDAHFFRVPGRFSARPGALVYRLLGHEAESIEEEAGCVDSKSNSCVCEDLEAQPLGARVIELTESLSICLR